MSGGIKNDIQETTTNKPSIQGWRYLSPVCIILTWWQVVGDNIGREVPLKSLKMFYEMKSEKKSINGHWTIIVWWKLPFQSRPERNFRVLQHQTSDRFALNSWCWWRSPGWWIECSGCSPGWTRRTPSCSCHTNSCRPRNEVYQLRFKC